MALPPQPRIDELEACESVLDKRKSIRGRVVFTTWCLVTGRIRHACTSRGAHGRGVAPSAGRGAAGRRHPPRCERAASLTEVCDSARRPRKPVLVRSRGQGPLTGRVPQGRGEGPGAGGRGLAGTGSARRRELRGEENWHVRSHERASRSLHLSGQPMAKRWQTTRHLPPTTVNYWHRLRIGSSRPFPPSPLTSPSVPEAGFEPASSYERKILSLVCMPFHHSGGGASVAAQPARNLSGVRRRSKGMTFSSVTSSMWPYWDLTNRSLARRWFLVKSS